jgi:protoheme IX farnesyltransferase
MLPVVAGGKETRRQIVIYTLLLVPLTLAPWLLGFSGPVYAIAASVLGAGFLVSVWRVATDRQDATGVSLTNDAPARAAFKFSIAYLFILFGALAIDHCVGRFI